MSDLYSGYVEKVPENHNPNAMRVPVHIIEDPDSAEYVRFCISCNHDDDNVLPDSIPPKPIHLPVGADGVVP